MKQLPLFPQPMEEFHCRWCGHNALFWRSKYGWHCADCGWMKDD